MGQIVAFPLARRLDFVERHARLMAGMRPEAAEGHLGRQLDIQRDALRRKQVPAAAIDREIKHLQNAIRAALWSAVLTPRGR
jgi:hypothetical protein